MLPALPSMRMLAMTRVRALVRVLGMCLALIGAGMGFASSARAQQPAEVRIAVLAPSALLWLHAIAKDQGFYTERKIDVKELVAGSSPVLLQAVSSGSVEAGISLGDVAIRAIDQGAPVIIAGAVLEKTILR